MRLLVRGYEPKERPDERFYEVMRQLSSIGNNVNQMARATNVAELDPDSAGNRTAELNKVQKELNQLWQQLN